MRGICACTDDRNDQNVVIDNAKDVLDEAQRMMEYSKVLLNNPDSADATKNLQEANKAVSNAINNLLNSLPGQKDVDSAIKEIARSSVAITDNQFPPTKVSLFPARSLVSVSQHTVPYIWINFRTLVSQSPPVFFASSGFAIVVILW